MALHSWFLSSMIAAAGLLAAGAIYEFRSRRRDARRFPPLGQLIDIGGRSLHLLIKGTDGPTVVIEQGAGGPSLAWLGLQEEISKFARVCLYDRAGYQWSDAVAGPRSLEDRVRDLHELLARTELPGPYVLVAHSYGGFLVRLFVRDYPGSVAGLVLVDTPYEQTYCHRDVLKRYSQFRWVLRAMKFLSIIGLPRLVNRLTAKPEAGLADEVGEQINAGMVRREYFAAASDDIGSLERAVPWLTQSKPFGTLGDMPVAVITHGRPFPGPFAVLEKGWREGQEQLAALSTNGELIVAEKSNHMIQMDEPEIVVDAIRMVVSRVRQSVP
jgi:pimeloyl-ACP methyl ester carboxylesterase